MLPSGRKVFRTSKRNGKTGDINTVTIGPFPSVTVDLAIKRHCEFIAEIIKGNDPNEAKREAKRKGITFSDLYEIYDKDFSAKVRRDERRQSSQEHNARLYKNHLSQIIDGKRRRLSEVTLEQIDLKYAAIIIDWLKTDKTKPVFNKCLTLLKSMFNVAISKQIIEKNPFIGQKKFDDTERKRYLQKVEIEQFFAAVNKEEQIYQDIIKMLLFTGQRKNCVLSMRWEELSNDYHLWSIPVSKMKGKEEHTIPLPTQCIDILNRIGSNKHPNGFVFPARHTASKLGHISEKTGASSFWRRITTNAGLYSTDKNKNLTMHDLRRSLASWQINNNVDLYTVSKTLGHKSIATTQKIYAHLNSEKLLEGVSSAVSALELASGKETTPAPKVDLQLIINSLSKAERVKLMEMLKDVHNL